MPAIGIDLGTTYSCVAVWQNNKVEIIANEAGNRTTPSYVAFVDDVRYVGEAAKDQPAINSQNTVFDVKRLIGKKFDEPSVQEDLKRWPFAVINDDSRPKVRVEFRNQVRELFPEEISAMVLEKMKKTAEAYLDCTVTDAVITVPAYFNDSQREATKDAATIAGLNVLRLISEPTAAALAYRLDQKIEKEKIILVYDLGGGTFDVSILKISDGCVFEVKSTAGDTHLGGEDFDNLLVDHLKNEFEKKCGVEITNDWRALRRLKTAAEQAKRQLSTMTETSVQLDALFRGMDFSARISRAKLESVCLKLLESTLSHVTDAIECAKLTKNDIDEVVLVGGSTRIPKVRKLLRDYFGGKSLNFTLNPDEAVAYGAAVRAAQINGDAENSAIENAVLMDVTPLSLGVEVKGDRVFCCVKRNTRIPCEKEKLLETSEDNQKVLRISVYEGERLMTKDNNFLGQFLLNDLPPGLRGEIKVIVVFKLDEDGILHVSAKLPRTGQSNSITINNEKGRLSNQTIQKMINEAVRFRAEDEIQLEKLNARLSLEDYTYKVKHAVAKAENKLSDDEKTLCSEHYQKVFKWLDLNPAAYKLEYENKLEELKTLCSSFMEKLKIEDKKEEK